MTFVWALYVGIHFNNLMCSLIYIRRFGAFKKKSHRETYVKLLPAKTGQKVNWINNKCWANYEMDGWSNAVTSRSRLFVTTMQQPDIRHKMCVFCPWTVLAHYLWWVFGLCNSGSKLLSLFFRLLQLIHKFFFSFISINFSMEKCVFFLETIWNIRLL